MLTIHANQMIQGDPGEGSAYIEDNDLDLTVMLDEEVMCRHCSSPIFEDSTDDWRHEDSIGDPALCGNYDAGDIAADYGPEFTRAEPAPSAGQLANSAGITISEDRIQVNISIGDPRGSLGLILRRLDDGRLILHVPHSGEQHVTLTELHEGTYLVG